MSWHKIDWLDVEVREYETALNDLVRESYLAAHSVLERTFTARKAVYEETVTNAQGELDRAFADSQLMYTQERWDEQKHTLTLMALSSMVVNNKSFLDQLKQLFDKTHPHDPKGYSGKSALHRQIAEYKARFGVDIESLKGFETLREAELARNSCLHNDGRPDDNYKQQTSQRLIGEHDRILITPTLLDTFLLELSEFAMELSSKMKTIRASETPLK